MPQIKALLFDKDGTILDFYKTWIPINRDMALDAARGDTALADDLLRAGGHDPETDIVTPGAALAAASMGAIAKCFADFLKDRAPADLEDIIARNFREGGAKYAALIDGVVEEISALSQQGYRLGIATNDTVDGMNASLGRFDGLIDMFEFRVGCDSGFGSKPAPGMGVAFARALAIDPAQCAMIGDTTHDLEMARLAGFGMRIGVLTGPSRHSDLAPHADLVIDSVCDLSRGLEQCRSSSATNLA